LRGHRLGLKAMGRKSIISRLPQEVKTYVEGLMADGRLTLDEMIANLQARWPSEAKDGLLPSKSALQRYGPKLERRLIGIKAFTDAGLAIKAHAKDDEDTRSAALTAIVQQDLFEAMMMLSDASDPEVDPAERVSLLNEAAKGIASLTRSSVTLKQYQAKVVADVRARLQAEQRDKLADLGRTGAVAPDVLALVIKAAYDL